MLAKAPTNLGFILNVLLAFLVSVAPNALGNAGSKNNFISQSAEWLSDADGRKTRDVGAAEATNRSSAELPDDEHHRIGNQIKGADHYGDNKKCIDMMGEFMSWFIHNSYLTISMPMHVYPHIT